MTKETIAKILKKLRNDAEMTQQQVADAIGRKQTTIASWETGQSQPDADTLFLLCDLYHVSADEAFSSLSRKKIADMTDAEVDAAIEKEGRELVDKINQLPPEAQEQIILFMKLSASQRSALTQFLKEMTKGG